MQEKAKNISTALLFVAVMAWNGIHAQPAMDMDESAFLVDDDILIETKDGAVLSAIVARPRGVSKPLPTALFFTIYTRNLEYQRGIALDAASHGYVGVVVDTRGKRLSPDPIEPFKHEVDDTYEAIDWIARQPWSNGSVGMYGGSYVGYAAWAATKRGHPALKTIVPYVADMRGQGLPMENNIFLNANYAWPFYVMNNKFLDDATYSDTDRWRALPWDWFTSGRPYRDIDKIDGTPNPLLQEWLTHPSYDHYWQAMVPFGQEYSRIDIPVLTIAGYYDDGQVSSLQYLQEHYRHKPDAEHYLIIGPYDHLGTQRAVKPAELRGYTIDPVAHFDTTEITFEWFDFVMRGGDKPALLSDKINYQVMGANVWRHATSIAEMSNGSLNLYLTDVQLGDHNLLSTERPSPAAVLEQTVDFSDRATFGHNYYPNPIIRDEFVPTSGFSFITEPLDGDMIVSGFISGVLNLMINKRDLDVQVVLYEVLPNDTIMQLSYYIGRASHARDMTTRTLLSPGEWESIPIDRSRMTSRQLTEGSRLLVVLDVIKDPMHQVNYGTGGDVSDESIEDAAVPLEIRWRTDSFVRIPVWRETAH